PVSSERMSTRAEGSMRLVQVAVPVPQLDRLTYSTPDEFPDPLPGARVLVPLGKRTVTGVVVPQSVLPDTESGIRSVRGIDAAPKLGFATTDPGSRTPDPGSRTPDPGSRIPDPGSRTADPGSRIRDPGSRT